MNNFGTDSAAYLRTLYKPGVRVVVLKMDDPYPVESGTEGSGDSFRETFRVLK